MRKITADYIYPITSNPIKNGVVVLNKKNQIIDILASAEELDNVEKYAGIICPGFVNTHCHLELSHMKGIVTEGKGLVEFIKELMSQREADAEFISQCIANAEAEMITNGIVAVGDISNGADSFVQKAKKNLYYHTFVELYGFKEEQAEESFKNGLDLISKYKEQIGHYSLVPHSPYSTSILLWKKIIEWNMTNNGIISFHNQETEDENNLFIKGTGSLMDLMQWFGLETSFWKTTKKTSLLSVKKILSQNNNTLLVHNTFTSKSEIEIINKTLKNPYWCLCPNANWYIERKTPNIANFIAANATLTMGTDSLSSNWGLSILSEMQRIKTHFPSVSTSFLLKWGTLNGANFLGISSTFGSLEKGKSPGLNLITKQHNGEITKESQVKKLV